MTDSGMSGARRPWTDEESDAAWATIGNEFIAVTRHLRRSIRRQRLEDEVYRVEETNLTPVQVDALEALVESGGCRMHELATMLDIDASTATRTVEPLVRLALVLRTVDEDDRRYVTLTPTAKGKDASAKITEGLHTMMREVLGGMAPERRLLLTRFLEEYVGLLDGYAARHGH